MANKTAEEIFAQMKLNYRLSSSADGLDKAIDEASRQLYEATMAIIGEDVDPYFTNDMGIPEPKITEARIHRNELRAELRAKARAFYGITETEEEGTE